jgi:hypothetical protein
LATNSVLADEQNRLNKKAAADHSGGMPEFEPTAEQREIVYKASGLPHADICCLIRTRAQAKASIRRRCASISLKSLRRPRWRLQRGSKHVKALTLGRLPTLSLGVAPRTMGRQSCLVVCAT